MVKLKDELLYMLRRVNYKWKQALDYSTALPHTYWATGPVSRTITAVFCVYSWGSFIHRLPDCLSKQNVVLIQQIYAPMTQLTKSLQFIIKTPILSTFISSKEESNRVSNLHWVVRPVSGGATFSYRPICLHSPLHYIHSGTWVSLVVIQSFYFDVFCHGVYMLYVCRCT